MSANVAAAPTDAEERLIDAGIQDLAKNTPYLYDF
jgi:hypothetical protein